jgi:hypothetical protein
MFEDNESFDNFVKTTVDFLNEESAFGDLSDREVRPYLLKFRFNTFTDKDLFQAVRSIEEGAVTQTLVGLANSGIIEMSVDENGDGLFFLNEQQRKLAGELTGESE